MIGLANGTVSPPAVLTLTLASSGRASATGSSSLNLPRSCRIIAATLVIGLVIDQIGNTVSSLIARS